MFIRRSSFVTIYWLVWPFKIFNHINQVCMAKTRTLYLIQPPSSHPLISKTLLSHLMTIQTKWLCAQRRLKISQGIGVVWSESSLCAQWVAKDPSFLHVDSEDSDQTGRMPRLIWVFAGCTATLLVLSWGSSVFLRLEPRPVRGSKSFNWDIIH